MRLRWCAALVIWGVTPIASAQRALRFEDYLVAPGEVGHASRKFNNKSDAWPDADPKFRDAALAALKFRPEFAGHYLFIQWSCGVGCAHYVLMDSLTGVLYRFAPFYSLFFGDPVSGTANYSGLSFRRDSRLVVAAACFGEHGGCWRRSYLWENGSFRLLQEVELR